MEQRATVVSPAPLDRVFDHLAMPRNLLMAHQRGSIESQSTDPREGLGSWAVLRFDQLRVRVEYTSFERPSHIEVSMRYSGFGSDGRLDTAEIPSRTGAGWGHAGPVSGETNRPPPAVVGGLMRALLTRQLRQKFGAIR